MTKIQS